MTWVGCGWRRFVPQPTVQGRPRVGAFVSSLPTGARWIDLGAGGRQLRKDVVRVDRDLGAPVEIVADAHRLPLGEGLLDAVISTGTLEHVAEPAAVLAEVRRVLREGGVVYVEVPFLQGYHADPADYWRFTQEGLTLLLTRCGFEVDESGAHMGPASAVCWIVAEVIAGAFGRGALARVGRLVGRLVVWPFKFLDYAIMVLPNASRVASGVWALGRKPARREA